MYFMFFYNKSLVTIDLLTPKKNCGRKTIQWPKTKGKHGSTK